MRNSKVKALALFSFAASLTLGVAFMNPVAAYAENETITPTFKMKNGASVRVSTADETAGLRFSATIDAASFEAYKAQGYTIKAGTFILPAAWYESMPVSVDACFDETPVYNWKVDEGMSSTAETVKAEILHVEALPYKTEATYTVNGSVLNLKDANLALEYIGQTYLSLTKDGVTEYIFAETSLDNARTVVEVAQQALLNKATDKAFQTDGALDETKVAAVDNDYIQRYIKAYTPDVEGDFPLVKYTESVWTETADGVYTEAKEEKTAEFKGYNTAVEMAEFEKADYAYYTAKSSPKATLLVDGTTAVNTYFNYNANRVTLWNGDDVTAEEYNKVDVYTMKDRATPFLDCFVEEESPSIYEGNSVTISPELDSWDGPIFRQGVVLPFVTDTLSLVINSPYAGSVKIQVYGLDANGSKLEPVVEGGSWGWATAIVEVKEGLNEVYAKFPREFKTLYAVSFRTRTLHKPVEEGATVQPADYVHYTVDSICAEKEYYTTGSISLPDTYLDSLTAKFAAGEVKSTKYFNVEMPTVKAEYQAVGDETWNALVLSGDTANVPLSADKKAYNVRLSLEGETLAQEISRKGLMIATFDEAIGGEVTVGAGTENEKTFINTAANRNYIVAATASQYWRYDKQGGDYKFDAIGDVATVEGYEGQFWQGNVNTWPGNLIKKGRGQFNTDKNLQFSKFGVWMYSTSDWTTKKGYLFWVGIGDGTADAYASIDGSRVTTIKKGYHYYEFTLENVESFTSYARIELNIGRGVYIDQIAFIA